MSGGLRNEQRDHMQRIDIAPLAPQDEPITTPAAPNRPRRAGLPHLRSSSKGGEPLFRIHRAGGHTGRAP
jgi:hypothetical protein